MKFPVIICEIQLRAATHCQRLIRRGTHPQRACIKFDNRAIADCDAGVLVREELRRTGGRPYPIVATALAFTFQETGPEPYVLPTRPARVKVCGFAITTSTAFELPAWATLSIGG